MDVEGVSGSVSLIFSLFFFFGNRIKFTRIGCEEYLAFVLTPENSADVCEVKCIHTNVSLEFRNISTVKLLWVSICSINGTVAIYLHKKR